jgi:hypothetical protein
MRCGSPLSRPGRTMQARYTGGSRTRMPAQPCVTLRPSVSYVRIPATHPVGAFLCIRVRNQPQAIGSPPLSRIRRCHVRAASTSDFAFIRTTQRTPALQRPQHVARLRAIMIGFPQSHAQDVSTPSARADGLPGRPVRSVPLANGPSESMPVRAIRVSGSRAVSCLSQRKAPRPLVSQTRTPESYPNRPLLGRVGPARQTYQPAGPGSHDVRVPGNPRAVPTIAPHYRPLPQPDLSPVKRTPPYQRVRSGRSRPRTVPQPQGLRALANTFGCSAGVSVANGDQGHIYTVGAVPETDSGLVGIHVKA